MPQPDGTLMEGETGGLLDGAAEEAANLLMDAAGGSGSSGSGSSAPGTGEGQGPESPTGTGNQEGASAEPSPSSKEGGGEADKGNTESGGESGSEGEDGKPPPYDQDPKWKAARAAESKLNSILEEHGFTNPDDLNEALKNPLADKIGDEDPEQVLKDAKAYRDMQAQRSEEDARRQEENETPEETIERLRQENQNLRTAEAERSERDQALEQSRQTIERYDRAATDLVETLDMGKHERELALKLLGVGNPMDEVDLDDRKAVASALREQVPAVQKAINTIRQRAIDEYAAGKSNLVPGKKAQEAGSEKPASAQKPGQGQGEQPKPGTGIVTDPTAEFQDAGTQFENELLNLVGEIAPQS